MGIYEDSYRNALMYQQNAYAQASNQSAIQGLGQLTACSQIIGRSLFEKPIENYDEKLLLLEDL